MTMLSKGCKPHKCESHHSLKLSFINICSLFFSNVNLSLNQILMTFILYVRQTWMTQLILAIEGRTAFCVWLISRKLCRLLLMILIDFTSPNGLLFFRYWSPSSSFCTVCDSIWFRLTLLHPMRCFFFLYWSPSSSLCTICDSISPNIHSISSKIDNSSGNGRPGELCYNFFYLKWSYSDG